MQALRTASRARSLPLQDLPNIVADDQGAGKTGSSGSWPARLSVVVRFSTPSLVVKRAVAPTSRRVP